MTRPASDVTVTVPDASGQGYTELSVSEFEWAAARLANGDLIGSKEEGLHLAAAHLSRTLRAILTDPDACRPPKTLLPYLCWSERLTVYSAGDKSGKSTLLTAAVAAFTSGRPFLGQPCGPGAALWLMAEEHASDLLTRALRFGADPDRFHVIPYPRDPQADLWAVVQALRPSVVVVDPLIRYAGDAISDGGSSAQWSPVMQGLLRVAREGRAGVVVLHHARKSDGRSRDSGDITAAADVVLEQLKPHTGGKQSLIVRGRWALEDFSVVLVGDVYTLEGGKGVPAAIRIVDHLRTHPGVGTVGLRKGVRGATRETDAALAELLRQGVVIDQGTGSRHQYRLAEGAATATVVGQGRGQAESLTHLTPFAVESQQPVTVESGSESGVHLTPPQTHRVEESGQSGEGGRAAGGRTTAPPRRSLEATSERGT